MKVLVVHPGPRFSVHDVYRGLVAGLRANGCEVGEFNLDDRLNFYAEAHITRDGEMVRAFDRDTAVLMASKGLETVCYEWWPDVVIVVSAFFVHPKVMDVLRRRPHHVVLWGTESPYEDDRQARVASFCDTVVLNDPTNLDEFRAKANARTYYMPHSYDPTVHFAGPGEPDLACDFAFVGTGFPSRIEFFEAVDWTGVNARLAGNWDGLAYGSPIERMLLMDRGLCLDNHDTARLYRACKVSANIYRKEHHEDAHADGWAMGPREVELAACGTFFLREPRPEGDELFPMLPTFTESGEFTELLHWWLKHDTARQAAADAARAAVADRTFTATTARLLQLVDGAPKRLAA